MCGVIGFYPLVQNDDEQVRAYFRLLEESVIRGMHAYGSCQPLKDGFLVMKESDIKNLGFNPRRPAIAHTRYCQSGDWRVEENNQPIVVGDMALAMNGVIHMGTKEEFEKAWDVQCLVDNDSEIFLQCLKKDDTPYTFLQKCTGSFAATWLVQDILYAARNSRRPLWYNKAFGAEWFASTKDIFRRALFPETHLTLLEPNKIYMMRDQSARN